MPLKGCALACLNFLQPRSPVSLSSLDAIYASAHHSPMGGTHVCGRSTLPNGAKAGFGIRLGAGMFSLGLRQVRTSRPAVDLLGWRVTKLSEFRPRCLLGRL